MHSSAIALPRATVSHRFALGFPCTDQRCPVRKRMAITGKFAEIEFDDQVIFNVLDQDARLAHFVPCFIGLRFSCGLNHGQSGLFTPEIKNAGKLDQAIERDLLDFRGSCHRGVSCDATGEASVNEHASRCG